jgi:hypothetical protein
MNFYIFLGTLLVALVIWEFYLRKNGLKFVNLEITDEDGTTRIVRTRVGRDPEVDALIKSVKERRKKDK